MYDVAEVGILNPENKPTDALYVTIKKKREREKKKRELIVLICNIYFYLFIFLILRYAGQVGYFFCGMKTTQEARVGDTFYLEGKPVEAFPGFKPAKPMVGSLSPSLAISSRSSLSSLISFAPLPLPLPPSLLGWVTPLVLETNGESLNHRCYHSRRKEVIGMGKGEVVGGVGV
jgi:hypothetical protein